MKILKSIRNKNLTRPKFTMSDNTEIIMYEREEMIFIFAYPPKNSGAKYFQQKLESINQKKTRVIVLEINLYSLSFI